MGTTTRKDPPSIFDEPLVCADEALTVDDIPPDQWQKAIGRRPLTPLEHRARERYFARQTHLAIARTRREREEATPPSPDRWRK